MPSFKAWYCISLEKAKESALESDYSRCGIIRCDSLLMLVSDSRELMRSPVHQGCPLVTYNLVYGFHIFKEDQMIHKNLIQVVSAIKSTAGKNPLGEIEQWDKLEHIYQYIKKYISKNMVLGYLEIIFIFIEP